MEGGVGQEKEGENQSLEASLHVPIRVRLGSGQRGERRPILYVDLCFGGLGCRWVQR